MEDIHNKFATYTSHYNKVLFLCTYRDYLSSDIPLLENIKRYHDFYNSIDEVEFNSTISKFATTMNSKAGYTALNLCMQSYIDFYEKSFKRIQQINFWLIIDTISKKEYGDATKLLESNFYDSRYMLDKYTKEKNLKAAEYIEKVEIPNLYKEQYNLNTEIVEFEKSISFASNNYYRMIYEKTQRLLNVLKCYLENGIEDNFSQKQEINNLQIPIAQNKKVRKEIFFNMKLISAIHKECNNKQFEDISEIDLYYSLNLIPTDSKISIKSKEKIRVCYLIYKLSELIIGSDNIDWRNKTLKMLNIGEGLYKSKYKEPVADTVSRKSEAYVQTIDKLLNNYT